MSRVRDKQLKQTTGSTGDVLTVQSDGSIAPEAPTGGSPNPTGTVLPFAGSSAPSGYLLCDGSAVSQSTYAALYAVIGTTYGDPGGGNFNLPDARGRNIIGVGTGAGLTPRALAATGGNESQGSHNHGGSSNGATPGTDAPTPVTGNASVTISNYGSGIPAGDTLAKQHTHTVTAHSHVVDSHGHVINYDGGHGNMAPFLALNCMIKT